MISKTERNITYPIALLLSTAKRKTFESLGAETGISGDTISRLATNNATTVQDLIHAAKKIFLRKKLYLLIDDTLILKTYSRLIEGTSDNYNSSDGNTYRSLNSVVAMLTDGITAIPIDQKIWTSREFNKNAYMKKWELAQQLILELQNHISMQAVIMDGLYAVAAFIEWLDENKMSFEMRFHSNRVIEKNGQRWQIKHSPLFKLRRGTTERTIRAFWRGTNLYFTALKRRLANGDFTIVFQVSNFKASVKQHVQLYGYRWNIEKFFRTAKQKLGLNDCQSRKLERQEGHIFNVFAAYTVAQYERTKQKLKNVEEAIKSIKLRNMKRPTYSFLRFREIFRYV